VAGAGKLGSHRQIGILARSPRGPRSVGPLGRTGTRPVLIHAIPTSRRPLTSTGTLLPGSHDEVRSRMDSYLAKETQLLVPRHGLTGAGLVQEPDPEDQCPVDSDHLSAHKRLRQARSNANAPLAERGASVPLRGFEWFRGVSRKQDQRERSTPGFLTGHKTRISAVLISG
jgi:hypothetical protein